METEMDQIYIKYPKLPGYISEITLLLIQIIFGDFIQSSRVYLAMKYALGDMQFNEIEETIENSVKLLHEHHPFFTDKDWPERFH